MCATGAGVRLSDSALEWGQGGRYNLHLRPVATTPAMPRSPAGSHDFNRGRQVKFAIQVHSSPYSSQGSRTACSFARAAIENGHEVFRVFFYFDGIFNALGGCIVPSDESGVVRAWGELARMHHIDLVVCVSAAQRRGLQDPAESARQGVESRVAEGFRISGLGQWAEAVIIADRVLVFGD